MRPSFCAGNVPYAVSLPDGAVRRIISEHTNPAGAGKGKNVEDGYGQNMQNGTPYGGQNGYGGAQNRPPYGNPGIPQGTVPYGQNPYGQNPYAGNMQNGNPYGGNPYPYGNPYPQQAPERPRSGRAETNYGEEEAVPDAAELEKAAGKAGRERRPEKPEKRKNDDGGGNGPLFPLLCAAAAVAVCGALLTCTQKGRTLKEKIISAAGHKKTVSTYSPEGLSDGDDGPEIASESAEDIQKTMIAGGYAEPTAVPGAKEAAFDLPQTDRAYGNTVEEYVTAAPEKTEHTVSEKETQKTGSTQKTESAQKTGSTQKTAGQTQTQTPAKTAVTAQKAQSTQAPAKTQQTGETGTAQQSGPGSGSGSGSGSGQTQTQSGGTGNTESQPSAQQTETPQPAVTETPAETAAPDPADSYDADLKAQAADAAGRNSAVVQDILSGINRARDDAGQAEVSQDGTLSEMCAYRSLDMIKRNYYSHEADGVSQLRVVIRAWGRTGNHYENLAKVVSDDPGGAAVRGWTGSAGHYAAMTSPDVNSVGICALQSDDGTWYITTIYAQN